MIVPLKKVTLYKDLIESVVKQEGYKDTYSVTIEADLYGETLVDCIDVKIATLLGVFMLSVGFIAGALIASITI